MKSLFEFSKEDLLSLQIVDWGYTENLEAMSFDHYAQWTEANQELSYLIGERLLKRKNLKNIYPEIESALVFLFSYAPTQKVLIENNNHRLAGYVLGFEGEDYHHFLRKRLTTLGEKISSSFKISLDIEPVLERDLAYRAGLGWFGKNSMLISRREGSYVMIGSILLPKKLPFINHNVETDHCGTCELCIKACPTDAIHPESRTIVLNKCLSTFTIEMRKMETMIPAGLDKSREEIFGCDICQDVCPWNKKKIKSIIFESLHPKAQELLNYFSHPFEKLLNTLSIMSGKTFQKNYKLTPLGRTGLKGMIKNIKAQILFSKN
jgi:epoxyqueuosine reductase